jgi:hypothetical protein
MVFFASPKGRKGYGWEPGNTQHDARDDWVRGNQKDPSYAVAATLRAHASRAKPSAPARDF